MFKYKLVIVVLTCFIMQGSLGQFGQGCTTLGQNPGTAFPVCGTDVFVQSNVPECGGRSIPGHCNSSDNLRDLNPFWYKFTCFTPGTLAFVITPKTQSDDYDWQLFDITGKNPEEVFTDPTLFVCCSWSGDTGRTGASAAGTLFVNCAGDYPRFSKMPLLILGHDYLLLISHFSGDMQSGYTLAFGGGTASITDPLTPHLLMAKAGCGGNSISVKLNKKMKCSSVDADGSDFSITPAVAPIVNATGIGCNSSFDMDSVVINLGNILPPGTYKVTVRANNNLLDNCNNAIPATDTLNFTVYPLTPTPMDSLSSLSCAPDMLQLVFKDRINCNSIAADGSDFIITGTSPVTVKSAAGVCSGNELSSVIQVQLSSPVQIAGSFQIHLVKGNDGNTIINECGSETPLGELLPFTTKDTVDAVFSSTFNYGCVADTIFYAHNGNNGVNSWRWSFGNSLNSSSQDTLLIFPLTAQTQATLIVSNGTCMDTATTSLSFDNGIKAAFEGSSVVCPGDPATFVNQSTSSLAATWAWNFGNGNVSTDQQPPVQYYPSSGTIKDVPVQLIVTNNIGCSDTATNSIKVVANCYIAIPKAFSPNGDGLNDYLYPTNAYKSKDLVFRVYNRTGQKIFETRDWTNKWDGTYNGTPQDPGTYVWILNYTTTDTNKKIEQKGTTVLIR